MPGSAFLPVPASPERLFGLIGASEAARRRWTRILSVAWPLVSATIYAFVQAPAAMVLASGVAQAVMLPMLGFAVLYFRYRRTDPNLAPSAGWDALLWISSTGLLIAGAWSLYSTLFG